MKFNMMIGGVETIFPEADVRYFKEDKKIVVYFLNLNDEVLNKTKKNIKQANLRVESQFLVLLLNDFQYALDLKNFSNLLELYNSGIYLRFAFEDENGNLLDIPTPTFSNEI